MTLPKVAIPKRTVKVGDGEVEVRGMTRAEAVSLSRFSDPDAAEAFVIACGAGLSEADAAAWRADTVNNVVDALIDEILGLSGLGDEVSKSDGPRADPRDA